MPKLFDNNSFEQWQVEGEKEITERALAYASQQLKNYQQPEIDPAIDEALLEYIARRESEVQGDVT